MWMVVLYVLMGIAVFFLYKTAKVGYQENNEFFYGIQKSKKHKEKNNEEKE